MDSRAGERNQFFFNVALATFLSVENKHLVIKSQVQDIFLYVEVNSLEGELFHYPFQPVQYGKKQSKQNGPNAAPHFLLKMGSWF